MADINIADILGAPNLCGIIQDTTTGIPNVLPPEFYKVDKVVDGNTGSFQVFTGTRTTARLSGYGQASSNRQLKNVGTRAAVLVHTVENIILEGTTYANLLDYNSASSKQKKGEQEVKRQIMEAKKNLDNLRIAASCMALFNGAIYFDNVGNLLPNSTNAATSTTFNVPAGNQGQCNALGTGNIISQGWNTNTATIDKQIRALQQAALQLTGYPLKWAFYGKNVPSYIAENAIAKEFMYRSPEQNPVFLRTAELASPTFGLNWAPAYQAFYEDNSGTNQPLIGDDQVIFCADPDPFWWGFLEGTAPVPTTYSVDPNNQIDSLEFAQGMFAYGVPIRDPITAKIVYGDTFLPVLKNPKTVFQATVAF